MFSKLARKSIAHSANRSTYQMGFCQGQSALVVFNIFIGNLDNGIENMFKFLENTKQGEIELFWKLCFEVKMFLPNQRKKLEKNLFNKQNGKMRQEENNLQR